MAARKNTVDKSKMTPEERQKYEARLAASREPKAAYLAYTVNENGTIEIGEVTRSAEEILAAVDKNRELKYARFMIK